MVEILIRNANAVDLPAILPIEKECGLGCSTVDELENELANSDFSLIIAKTHNRTVGYLRARLITNAVEIDSFGVIKTQRRKGVGFLLLQKLIEDSRQRQVAECWLEVRQSNETAQRFYLKQGFQIVGSRKNYYTNPIEDALLMTLQL